MMRPLFITFEGGEGTGKSTQVQILAHWLTGQNRSCITTREPGGTGSGEAVRSLLVTGEPDRWTANAEALLNYAARDMHLDRLIRPALTRGDCVISDRFMDSTRAYQHYAGRCSKSLIDSLEREIVAGTRPNLTLIFDLDPALGLVRAKARGGVVEDRFERKGLAFHHLLRDGFLEIAREEPDRCKVIDASGTVEDIAAAIAHHVGVLLHG